MSKTPTNTGTIRHTNSQGLENVNDVVETNVTGGSTHSHITNLASCEAKSVSIVHIPAGTTPTGSLAADIPIHRIGYYVGVIHISIVDGTPAGDLGGTIDIAYSMDGVTFTNYSTLAAVANIGIDDSQDIYLDLSELEGSSDTNGFARLIKLFPYFKIRESITGTLASVTFGVDVHMEK